MKIWLIKHYVKKYIHLAPIILLIITVLSNFIEFNYLVVGNSLGYSIFTNFFLWIHFNFYGDYCWFTRKAPLGLMGMNLVNIIGGYLDYGNYEFIFTISVFSVILILLFIFNLKKVEKT